MHSFTDYQYLTDRRTDGDRFAETMSRSAYIACRRVITRSSADADNRLDAFSCQSRSTNMVPLHMLD